MRPFLTSLGIALLFCGCQPEDIRFDDNPVPHYDGVPTVVLDAYLTRAYIDLIGREPLQGENLTGRPCAQVISALSRGSPWSTG